MNLCYFKLLFLYVLCYHFEVSVCDTWITLWNKLETPVEIHCQREGLFKKKDFKKKIINPDDRYDIKGKYPVVWLHKYYRHWCDVTAGTTHIEFDVFGGSDKRINKMSDSYSDWIINKGGIYRVKKGSLILYYGKNWLGKDYEDIDDEISGTPEQELNPEDTQKIAPLEVHLTSSTLTLSEQRLAIDKATYASYKFKKTNEMVKYVTEAMKKKFGSFWAVFVDQPENTKVVKRTCDTDRFMIFRVNEIDFIVCRIMR